jgi:TolB-like protein/tetratricopeptide (TPR) repeat protein
MTSIIEGYNYDIFISYRQKDNKHDGWVTEFVNQLKGELEATFKEDISIYFDENPFDGLLETHSVDKSLEGKLKCLIFIPIISQTYCDSKSFAWQHEFCAFNKLAKEDPFGRDIKLSSGNVASRILPVKIHDLDPEDKTLLEKELGAVLRCIEFIFKSAGVNRPLLASEDHPHDNLNKTYYRDQVNKVANAVKEIISAIKNPDQKITEISEKAVELTHKKPVDSKLKVIAVLLLLTALIVPGYFFIPKLFIPSRQVEKTVAVLPFENLGENREDDWFGEAMTDETIMQLYKIKELIVRSRTSVMQYKKTAKTIPVIGKELNVNYLIEGSVQRFENQVKIRVTLINAVTDIHLWGETYERKWEDISSLQSIIAKQVAVKLETVLTPAEKEQIEKVPTNNPEAYSSYLQGRFFWNKRTAEGLKKSIEYFSKSVKEDPNYSLAYAGMADAYYILAWWGWYPRKEGYSKSKEYALEALKINKDLADAHATLGTLLCWSEWNWKEAAKELKLATELNPNCVTAHQYYSELLDIIRNNKEAREQIDAALKLDPFSTAVNATSALYFYNEHKFGEAINVYQRTLEINPNFLQAHIMNFEIYLKQGEDLKAAEAIQQYMLGDSLTVPVANILKEEFNKSGIKGILTWLIGWQQNNPAADLYVAKWYAMLDKKKESLEYLRKIIELHSSDIPGTNIYPDEIPRIYNSPNFDNLRSEPEFQTIIKKMGLSEYQNADK